MSGSKKVKIYVNGRLKETTSESFTVVGCSVGDKVEVKINGLFGDKIVGEKQITSEMHYEADKAFIRIN